MAQRDLTVGNPRKVLWKFCLPLFASVVFQQLYNIADSFVAGKFISEYALAAVGNGYEIILIFLAFSFGCNIGSSVIVANLLGAKKHRDLKTAVSTSLIFSGVLCLVLMIGCFLFCDRLLSLMSTPKNIFDDSKLYLLIYTLGLPFVFYYNISTGIFSAMGDSKTPFIFLAISSVANIIIDVVFVTVFDMGVAGVGWATFLCQGVSCILALICVFNKLSKLKTSEKPKLFSKSILYKILKIAIPSAAQQSFISVGNMIIQSVINSYGPSVIAGYSAATKVNGLVTSSFTTIGNGISSYTAQNIGAEKYERVKSGFIEGLKLVWIVSIPFTILYLVFGRELMLLFIKEPTEESINAGVSFLRIASPFYFVIASKLATDGILRGTKMMKRFMITTLMNLILRVSLAVILSKFLGTNGIWMAWPIGWIIGTILSLIFVKDAFLEKVNKVYA